MAAGVLKSYVDIENKGVTAFTPTLINTDLAVLVPEDFPTIQLALDSLTNVSAATGITATISVASGVHSVVSLAYNNNYNLTVTVRGRSVPAPIAPLSYTGVRATDEVVFRAAYPTIIEVSGGNLFGSGAATGQITMQHLGLVESGTVAAYITPHSGRFNITQCGFFGGAYSLLLSNGSTASVTLNTCLLLHQASTSCYFKTTQAEIISTYIAYCGNTAVYADAGAAVTITNTDVNATPTACYADNNTVMRYEQGTLSNASTGIICANASSLYINGTTLGPSFSAMQCSHNAVLTYNALTLVGPVTTQASTGSSTRGYGTKPAAMVYIPVLGTSSADLSRNN